MLTSTGFLVSPKYLVESQRRHRFIGMERGTRIAYSFYQNTFTQAFVSVFVTVLFLVNHNAGRRFLVISAQTAQMLSVSRLACVRPPVTDQSRGVTNHNGCKTLESCVVWTTQAESHKEHLKRKVVDNLSKRPRNRKWKNVSDVSAEWDHLKLYERTLKSVLIDACNYSGVFCSGVIWFMIIQWSKTLQPWAINFILHLDDWEVLYVPNSSSRNVHLHKVSSAVCCQMIMNWKRGARVNFLTLL